MFVSDTRGYQIIGEHNWQSVVNAPQGLSKGYSGRDWVKVPFGSQAYAPPRSRPLIDESEWDDRIEEMEKTQSRLSDLFAFAELPVYDQNGTNYCWANGTVGGVMVARAYANLPKVHLSPASVAARLTGYKNEGGWGGQCIEGINRGLLTTVDLWPANAIDRQYDTPEAKADGQLHKVLEFSELKPKNFKELMTCLLLREPVPIGLLWWGHLVLALDPVKLGRGEYGVRFLNSWGIKWGVRGMEILTMEKALADEAHSIRVAA